MTESLERRYRRLLSAYPGSYQRERGDEILATLLDMSAPDRRWPAPREVAGLLVGAARTHVRINVSRPAQQIWAGGLRLAALFLLAQACSQAAVHTGFDLELGTTIPPVETAAFLVATLLCAGALANIASGRYWLGCAAVVGAIAAEMVGSHGYRSQSATAFGPAEPFFWPLALAVAACAALIWVRPPAGRGLMWLLAIPLTIAMLPDQMLPNYFNPTAPTADIRPYAALIFLAACLLSTVVDSRIPIAAAAVCLSVAADLLHSLLTHFWHDKLWLIFCSVAGFAGLLLASVPLGRLVLRSRPTSAR